MFSPAQRHRPDGVTGFAAPNSLILSSWLVVFRVCADLEKEWVGGGEEESANKRETGSSWGTTPSGVLYGARANPAESRHLGQRKTKMFFATVAFGNDESPGCHPTKLTIAQERAQVSNAWYVRRHDCSG